MADQARAPPSTARLRERISDRRSTGWCRGHLGAVRLRADRHAFQEPLRGQAASSAADLDGGLQKLVICVHSPGFCEPHGPPAQQTPDQCAGFRGWGARHRTPRFRLRTQLNRVAAIKDSATSRPRRTARPHHSRLYPPPPWLRLGQMRTFAKHAGAGVRRRQMNTDHCAARPRPMPEYIQSREGRESHNRLICTLPPARTARLSAARIRQGSMSADSFRARWSRYGESDYVR